MDNYTAAQWAVLQTELSTDPLARGYAGMTDLQAATSLASANRTIARTVSVDAVRQYLITQINGTGNTQRSAIDMLREFAEAGTVRGVAPTVSPTASLDARRSACRMIWFMLQREDSDALFPVDSTAIRNQFLSIGPDGGNGPSVLTAAQLTAIDALAVVTASRAAELGIPAPEARHIRWARGA